MGQCTRVCVVRLWHIVDKVTTEVILGSSFELLIQPCACFVGVCASNGNWNKPYFFGGFVQIYLHDGYVLVLKFESKAIRSSNSRVRVLLDRVKRTLVLKFEYKYSNLLVLLWNNLGRSGIARVCHLHCRRRWNHHTHRPPVTRIAVMDSSWNKQIRVSWKRKKISLLSTESTKKSKSPKRVPKIKKGLQNPSFVFVDVSVNAQTCWWWVDGWVVLWCVAVLFVMFIEAMWSQVAKHFFCATSCNPRTGQLTKLVVAPYLASLTLNQMHAEWQTRSPMSGESRSEI